MKQSTKRTEKPKPSKRKANKDDKTLTRLIRDRTVDVPILVLKGETSTYLTDIKRIIRKSYKQFHISKCDNVDEREKFIFTYSLHITCVLCIINVCLIALKNNQVP